MLWVRFFISAFLIIFAGTRLTYSAEKIARWTGLSNVWAGVFLLPLVTSLPELVNSWRSAVIVAPDLAAGNLLGSSLFNLSIIAFIDVVQGRGSLLRHLRVGHTLTAVLIIVLASVIILGIILPGEPVVGWLSWPSFVLIFLYLYGSVLLWRYEKKLLISTFSTSESKPPLKQEGVPRALAEFFVAAIVIIVAGINLTDTADLLAVQTGLGHTFVGSLFIAISTSLPEGVTTYTAVRLGALDMAVANVLGANFINLTLFSISDLFYREGVLFADIATDHIVSAIMVIILVSIFIFGLIYRSQRHVMRIGYDSLLIVLGYVAAFIFLFISG